VAIVASHALDEFEGEAPRERLRRYVKELAGWTPVVHDPIRGEALNERRREAEARLQDKAVVAAKTRLLELQDRIRQEESLHRRWLAEVERLEKESKLYNKVALELDEHRFEIEVAEKIAAGVLDAHPAVQDVSVRVRDLHASAYEWNATSAFEDKELTAFIRTAGAKFGEIRQKPRAYLKALVDMLDARQQHIEVQSDALIENAAAVERDDAHLDDTFVEAVA